MKNRILALTLCLALLCVPVLSGCAAKPTDAPQSPAVPYKDTFPVVYAADLMAGVKASTLPADAKPSEKGMQAVADFSVALFRKSHEAGENLLVSPLSVLLAIAMTANGAKGDTLAQMEQAFGISMSELNEFVRAYMGSLPSGEKYKLSPANSIWFKDSEEFTAVPEFLQTNADYYGADAYKAPFDDSTLKEINGWVNEKTDGMIEDILDDISPDAVMYLINALAFDAEWQNIYNEYQIQDGTFTTQSGEQRKAELMYSSENAYLDDGNATGFIKYYADQKYAFAALLPNEGLSVADYIATLTGDKLSDTLKNARDVEVNAAIPKFETESSIEMNGVLTGMGMTDAFDGGLADFSGLGHSSLGNIFISRVLHKTFISVDERGTKAGAATIVEMRAMGMPLETETVHLDRPFVYMLIDCETFIPVFIGAMMDTGK